MDRVKELETAIEKAIEAIEPLSALRASAAYSILRAALTPAEKVPLTCPRCGKPLVDCTDSIDEFVCVAKGCGYSQKDSAQRPKMPVGKMGHHATDWRTLRLGDSWYDAVTGEIDFGASQSDIDRNLGERWIAVKDAPVSEPVPFHEAKVEQCRETLQGCVTCKLPGNRRVEVWGVKGKGDTVIRIYSPTTDGKESCLKFGLRRDAALALCQGLNTQLADAGSVVRLLESLEPPVKVPVVEYWRSQSGSYIWKVIGKHAVEAVNTETGEIEPSGFDLDFGSGTKSTEAEYESARKPVGKLSQSTVADSTSAESGAPVGNGSTPTVGAVESPAKAKPAIEPLGDTEFGRAEMHDKINELIARVNALEGGGGK